VVVQEALERTSATDRGAHRLPAPPPALRGRVVVAAVAIGAFAAAAAGQTISAASAGDDLLPVSDSGNSAFGVGGDGSRLATTPQILTVAQTTDASSEARKLTQSAQLLANRTAKIAAEKAEAERPRYVLPAEGSFTSPFGPRWGVQHYGIDIAGRFGSPIRAVADGVVIEAGPASGFGLWVRVQHSDGTISVYGHMDSITIKEGASVKAGQQIARMGNRGQSTGTHLHLEIWDSSGRKIDPRAWLRERGIRV
jgi:murein DD-endopeptidase MepM/ murein hydrolase activator NlpD